jgi:hypothetical protein
MATKYGQDAIDANEKRKYRNKIIRNTLGVVLAFAITYGTLIHYFG